jgi:hypothetical protein
VFTARYGLNVQVKLRLYLRLKLDYNVLWSPVKGSPTIPTYVAVYLGRCGHFGMTFLRTIRLSSRHHQCNRQQRRKFYRVLTGSPRKLLVSAVVTRHTGCVRYCPWGYSSCTACRYDHSKCLTLSTRWCRVTSQKTQIFKSIIIISTLNPYRHEFNVSRCLVIYW